MLEVHGPVAPSDADALRILRDAFGLTGRVRAVAGERDSNFHVRTPDNREFVLKIAPPDESPEVLALQNAALSHLASYDLRWPVPRVISAQGGESIAEAEVEGAPRLARLLTWLPGEPLALVRPHSADLLDEAGESLGALAAALADFRHPTARRDLKWDLANAEWIGEHVARIANGERRGTVERLVERYIAEIKPRLAQARTSVVHNDANDYNLLVRFDAVGRGHIAGILDFGDVIETATVCDLAIALAYLMMGKVDPLSAGAPVVAAYHRAFPLLEEELAFLMPLVRARLAVSVVNAALQREHAPANTYLQVSEEGAWALLDALAPVHDRLAEYRFREVCGFIPCPKSVAVTQWIEQNRGSFSHVVGYPLDTDNVYVYDLSVGSGELGTIDEWRDARRFTRRLSDMLRDRFAKGGIGRYDEARPFYTSDVFSAPGNDGPEWRSVHIALDVFLPPGATVYAPLAGTVHSLRDNANPLDYGPTVVLEHTVDEGRLTFWTLYGHLSRESLARLKAGQSLGAGDIVGFLGDIDVNGGWPPHLHFQITCDLLDREGDFPGVARPSERETWLSISPDPSVMLGARPGSRAPRPPTVTALRERRTARIGKSLSISYRRPIHMVRGVMQHMIDADGRRYLDAVNNVAHVGHAHPDVVRAGQRQMATLNTNTRYLHELLVEYAERITATLPESLRVCYFVCSGSEANELALRLARAHTNERDVIVLESGYHGNTSTLVEVSSYKFDGPGGSGPPPWVQKVPMPDTYRGPFAKSDPQAGLKYAQAVREAVGRIRQPGRRPAAFLCESVLSCGGQIVLPNGYLAEAYRHVRAAGGVCIADEVQVGFGRVGSHVWAFQMQGVVPDVVTMGKPIGNGHPLGAVVTTPEIAASFANGMEYFNTFGGNPVSCAIGLEVLAVMEREARQTHALRIGEYLMKGLAELGNRHPLIGDVRGRGLFIGVELVRDRDERVPATRQAGYVANRLRECGILLSTDGPDNNVLKIKPPMCFDERDADFLVESLDRVLGEHPARTDK